MKTLSIYLVLAIFCGVLHAQEITELKEAKVGFAPLSSEVTQNGDSFIFKVSESYTGEFEKDPVAFLNNHFVIKDFISQYGERKYASYSVTFKSKKGRLLAHFDKDGSLRKTSEKFNDIILPDALRHQLYRDHKGWTMVKNVHIKNAKDGMVNKDIYHIKMELDNRKKNFKIDASTLQEARMANN